jgi:arginyl-tRNA synthetase
MQMPVFRSTEAQAKAIPLLIAEFSINWEYKIIIVMTAYDKDGLYYKFVLKFESDDIQLFVIIRRDGSYSYTSTF